MTARGTPSRFLQSVLHNGVGRYVCQLKRISLIFSKKGQGSLGVRWVYHVSIVYNNIVHRLPIEYSRCMDSEYLIICCIFFLF